MKVAVIDYNAGNVRSVLFALDRLGIEGQLTHDHQIIQAADRVIFPGVGEASTTMQYLQERGLDRLIPELTQPVLGICLGMQLLCSHSEENDTPCLNVFPMQVKKFKPADRSIKVPHMGWNQLQSVNTQILPAAVKNAYCYFVHSYYVETNDYSLADCDYVIRFSAIIQKDNFRATQFHPEKSGLIGQHILQSFIDWQP